MSTCILRNNPPQTHSHTHKHTTHNSGSFLLFQTVFVNLFLSPHVLPLLSLFSNSRPRILFFSFLFFEVYETYVETIPIWIFHKCHFKLGFLYVHLQSFTVFLKKTKQTKIEYKTYCAYVSFQKFKSTFHSSFNSFFFFQVEPFLLSFCEVQTLSAHVAGVTV